MLRQHEFRQSECRIPELLKLNQNITRIGHQLSTLVQGRNTMEYLKILPKILCVRLCVRLEGGGGGFLLAYSSLTFLYYIPFKTLLALRLQVRSHLNCKSWVWSIQTKESQYDICLDHKIKDLYFAWNRDSPLMLKWDWGHPLKSLQWPQL